MYKIQCAYMDIYIFFIFCLGKRLCRVQVNSEQVSLESLAEAGERLCSPDIGRELIPP